MIPVELFDSKFKLCTMCYETPAFACGTVYSMGQPGTKDENTCGMTLSAFQLCHECWEVARKSIERD